MFRHACYIVWLRDYITAKSFFEFLDMLIFLYSFHSPMRWMCISCQLLYQNLCANSSTNSSILGKSGVFALFLVMRDRQNEWEQKQHTNNFSISVLSLYLIYISMSWIWKLQKEKSIIESWSSLITTMVVFLFLTSVHLWICNCNVLTNLSFESIVSKYYHLELIH